MDTQYMNKQSNRDSVTGDTYNEYKNSEFPGSPPMAIPNQERSVHHKNEFLRTRHLIEVD